MPRTRPAVSLLPFLLVTTLGAVLALLLRRTNALATAIAVIALLGALVTALAIRPGQAVAIGGAGLATTDYLRLFLVLGATVGLLLAIIGQAVGSRRGRAGRDPRVSSRRRLSPCRCPTRAWRSSRPRPGARSERS